MGENYSEVSAAFSENIEIERKFIIVMPENSVLSQYEHSEIIQTYLCSAPRVTHRVRSRTFADKTIYTETKKIRIDKISCVEDEREITLEEYSRLLLLADKAATPIKKQRYIIPFEGRTFEVDIYDGWKKTCIMEVELPTRDEEVEFPPFIKIVREVTGEKAYSNASMSAHFPPELSIE